MQRGEATLPTATPSQTCPSCCASLPTGSLPTGIPQQPWLSRQQCLVHSCLPPAMPGGHCLLLPGAQRFLPPSGSAEQGLLPAAARWVLSNLAPARGAP